VYNFVRRSWFMIPCTGFLREWKILFDAYICTGNIKSYD
jgi:hypothetical protein